MDGLGFETNGNKDSLLPPVAFFELAAELLHLNDVSGVTGRRGNVRQREQAREQGVKHEMAPSCAFLLNQQRYEG